MLFVLRQLASGGGPSFVLGIKDASQDSRVIGGMGAVSGAMAAELGDSIRLNTPVRRIIQDGDGVTVEAEDATVRANRVIVAVPIAIASHILYEPMLPVDRSFLHQRMPSGAVVKINIVYDEPFWRNDGLTGQTFAPGSLANLTIDASTDQPRPGVMCVITEGPEARRYSKMDHDERRKEVLAALVERFGEKAADPGGLPRPGLDRRAATPAVACSATHRPVCSPNSGRPSPNPAVASTGRAPKRRGSCTDGSTAPSAPVSGRPKKSCSTNKQQLPETSADLPSSADATVGHQLRYRGPADNEPIDEQPR